MEDSEKGYWNCIYPRGDVRCLVLTADEEMFDRLVARCGVTPLYDNREPGLGPRYPVFIGWSAGEVDTSRLGDAQDLQRAQA